MCGGIGQPVVRWQKNHGMEHAISMSSILYFYILILISPWLSFYEVRTLDLFQCHNKIPIFIKLEMSSFQGS